jgi:hypothetical protein
MVTDKKESLELLVERERSTHTSTTGALFCDGKRVCWTLEDPVRVRKVDGMTAIPAGRYRVIITLSNRFKRLMPLLLNVPDFEGIRIHPGNVAADTHGCILVGLTRGADRVDHSREAYAIVYDMIHGALQDEREVWITIRNHSVVISNEQS